MRKPLAAVVQMLTDIAEKEAAEVARIQIDREAGEVRRPPARLLLRGRR